MRVAHRRVMDKSKSEPVAKTFPPAMIVCQERGYPEMLKIFETRKRRVQSIAFEEPIDSSEGCEIRVEGVDKNTAWKLVYRERERDSGVFFLHDARYTPHRQPEIKYWTDGHTEVVI